MTHPQAELICKSHTVCLKWYFLCKLKWYMIILDYPDVSERNIQLIYKPRREKTGLRGFRPGPTQTGLYKLRKELEACNFGFK